MFEQFDEQAKRIEDEKDSRKNAPAQWEMLKHFVSQLSSGHRAFDGHPFQWIADEGGTAILRLNEVAAQFVDESRRDVSRRGYRIRFGQRPLGPQEVRLEELVSPEEWELEPGTLEGEFIWLVDGKRFTPETLADAVALKVTECHQEFEESNRF